MNVGSRWTLTALIFLGGCEFFSQTSQEGGKSNWPAYGQNDAGQRYASLDQIDVSNVNKLGLEWYHEFDTDRGQQATPIMVDGVIYTSTAWSKVYALDARTGKLLWGFDPQVPVETLAKGCCDAINRGVSVKDGRVFVATLDGRLIALDAKTGKRVWSVMTVDQSKTYTITGATAVVNNLVLIGNAGAEFGVRGYISAYDTATGKMVWRFYTVPNPDGKPDGQVSDAVLKAKAAPTWFGKGWHQSGGGGTVWDSMAYDPDADMLYFGVGNGSPWNHKDRSDGKGDNLFLSSILAVTASTGEYKWHYQTTPGDSWDYTATQHIMLLDMDYDGKPRKLLVQAPKNGFFYVLDRTNGKLLSAKPYSRVNWAKGIDLVTGRPIEVPEARYTTKPFVQYPSSMGGHSWPGMAFSPETRLVYISTQEMAGEYANDPRYKYRPGLVMNIAQDMSKFDLPDDPAAIAAMKADTYGELVAWDPVKQQARWKVKHPYAMNGGVLATAGNLVFQGTADGFLKAYDANSGKALWNYRTTNGIVAPPISYQLDGKQYVAVMVGYGGPMAMYGNALAPDRPRLPGRLMVFTLDGKARAAKYTIPAADVVDLTGVSSNGDPVAGLAIYNDSCINCHGFSATSRYTADLRRSQMIKTREDFRRVVIDGVLKDHGMVSFARYYSLADVENLRSYVIKQAKKVQSDVGADEK